MTAYTASGVVVLIVLAQLLGFFRRRIQLLVLRLEPLVELLVRLQRRLDTENLILAQIFHS